jgi:hypothetical protein
MPTRAALNDAMLERFERGISQERTSWSQQASRSQ